MGLYDFLQEGKEDVASARNSAKAAQYAVEAAADGGIAANTLSANRAAYGWTPAEVATQLAREGRGDTDKVVGQVAVAAVKPLKRKGFWDKDRGWYDPRQEMKRALMATTRTAVVGLSIPFDVVKAGFQWAASDTDNDGDHGLFKHVEGNASSVFKTSAGLVAIGDLLSGRKVSLGSGYLPGGKIAKSTLAAQRTIQVDGHAATLGRMFASLFVDPGTKPYNVLSGIIDFSAAIGLDPANAVGTGIAKVRDARKLITPAGTKAMTEGGIIVGGVKKAFSPQTAEEYVRSGKGARFVEWAKDQTDFNDIWEGTNKKLPVELVAKLQGTGTTDEVLDAIMPYLGTQVREVPKMRHRGYSRIGQMMPEGHIDSTDVDQAVTEIDRYQRLLHVPAAVRSQVNSRMATAVTPSDKMGVATDLFRAVNAHIKGGGLKTEASNKLTRMFENSLTEMRKYYVDAVGDDVLVDFTTVGGKNVPTLSPHLPIETLHRDIPMPDVRELVRGLGTINRQDKLFGPTASKVLGANANLTDYVLSPFMEKVWKPQVLLRGAWTLRVVGEEQIRMAAAGLDSMFKHPLSAIAVATGRKGNMTLTDDAAGLDELTEFTEALSRRGGAVRGAGSARGGKVRSGHTVYRKGEQGFTAAWAGELASMAQDPLTRSLASQGLDATLLRVRDGGDLAKVRGAVAKALDEPALRTDAGSDLWVKSLHDRLMTKTQGQPDLIEAVGKRSWDGEAMFKPNGGMSKKFKAELTKRADDLPDGYAFKGEVALSQDGGDMSAYDAATDYLFHSLMSKPSNYLSRSPAWKQTYWQRVGELAGSMLPDDAAKAIARAKEAGLDAKQIKGMQRGTQGTLSFQDVDDLAKAYALETTKKLLYSSQAKHQWADASRIVAPFGEAWQEVLTTWTKQMVHNPINPTRNVSKGFQAAEQSGAIYEDPQSGDMRYIHPFSFFSSKWNDTAQTGSVKALNLIGEGMPGVGPAVTMLAKPLVDDDNEILYDLLWPMGKKPKWNEDPLGAMAPSHWRKFFTAIQGDPDKAAELGSLKMRLYEARVAGGKIKPPANSEDLYKGLEEAERTARYLMLGEGLASLFGLSPTTLKSEPILRNEEGVGEIPESVEGTLAAFVSADFRKFSDENYKTALDRLMEKYGDLSYLFAQSQTFDTAWGSLPYTKEAKAWKQANAEFAQAHPETYGFFAPAEGTEDMTVFSEAISAGTRKRLPGKISVLIANDRMAKAEYYAEKDRIEAAEGKLSKEAIEYLKGFKEALIEDYPGAFPADDRTPHDIPQEQAITDLFAAAKKLGGSNKTAAAVLEYEAERAEVIASLKARGTTLTSKTKAAAEREYLAGFGRALLEDEPAFRGAWDFLLTKEVEDFATETKREEAEGK